MDAPLIGLVNVKAVISRLKEQWQVPMLAVHGGEVIPVKLACRFAEGATDEELSIVRDIVPTDLLDFWKEAREADLFVDVQYGQWGLRMWAPSKAMEKTRQLRLSASTQLTETELVIGEFFGDTDHLLILRCVRAARDFASIVVGLGMDLRSDWPIAAKNFAAFLRPCR